jgi:hypothetical protein
MLTTNRGVFSLNDTFQKSLGGDWPTPDNIVRVLDDVTPLFDGVKSVFGLTINTANLSTVINNTIADSKDFDVALNGIVIPPYVVQRTWPWITPYDAFNGFRIVGDQILFYTAPQVNSTCSIILRNASSTQQERRYPFTTSSIALGD